MREVSEVDGARYRRPGAQGPRDEREDQVITIAYHESGRTPGAFARPCRSGAKISIISRGRALGSPSIPDEDNGFKLTFRDARRVGGVHGRSRGEEISATTSPPAPPTT